MSELLATWHDFNVSVVTAAAALLGLLFVALSLHLRALAAAGNAELRAVARTVFLGRTRSQPAPVLARPASATTVASRSFSS